MDPETLRGMVASAATGYEVAFGRIVAAHHDDMARVSFVVCGDVTLAQEAVQSAWPKVWAKLGTVRDPARLRPWLVSVAANEAKQLARSRNRRWVREVAIDETIDASAGRTDIGKHAQSRHRALELDLADAPARLQPHG